MALERHAPLGSAMFDREFWCKRLAYLESTPRRLLIVPRPELSRPGIEVAELKLRAHDGERLTALFGRSCFGTEGQALQIRLLAATDLLGVSWETLETGRAEIAFRPPAARRLEDRVLDLLRIVNAVNSLEGLATCSVEFLPPRHGSAPDEIWIAEQVLEACGARD